LTRLDVVMAQQNAAWFRGVPESDLVVPHDWGTKRD
jgi:hypothetical protein